MDTSQSLIGNVIHDYRVSWVNNPLCATSQSLIGNVIREPNNNTELIENNIGLNLS